jgi:hypothetical protein
MTRRRNSQLADPGLTNVVLFNLGCYKGRRTCADQLNSLAKEKLSFAVRSFVILDLGKD